MVGESFSLDGPLPLWLDHIPGVYKIHNKVTNKCYIGSSQKLRRRASGHRKGFRSGNHENPHLRNSWAKYGGPAFEFSILEYCAPEDLITREQYWMDLLQPNYNIARIAGSNAGVKHGPMPKSQREKIGAANKGRVCSPEARKKMSQVRKGVAKSQAFKDNLSRVLSGRVPTEVHRANLSKALKGKLFGSALKESQKTHCPSGHEYNKENTSWEGSGKRQRICKVCKRIRQRKAYQKKNMHKIQVPGSGSAVHTITVHDNKTVSCSCPAWRNQSLPPDLRTCKHIKAAGFTSASLVATRAEGEPVVAPTTPVIKEEPPVLLAHPWDNSQDLSGWWMSEKYDGVRCWWDGDVFVSRQGNPYNAPTWFIQQLPKVPLDGELWMGRKLFQETVGAVRKHTPVDAEWSKVKYMVFDLPKHRDPFEVRQQSLITYVGSRQPNVEIVPQILCRGMGHLRQSLQEVLDKGGEGLMMRQPGSLYESGRSNTLLKVKRFFDAEAVVTGYEPGKGRHKGRVGALMAVTATGVPFKIGTGLSDREREKPPAIGSRVTYRYQELTKDSVPRFPSFVCVRDYE